MTTELPCEEEQYDSGVRGIALLNLKFFHFNFCRKFHIQEHWKTTEIGSSLAKMKRIFLLMQSLLA